MAKVGVWLVGAQGSLASTVVLGARAIARKLAADGGLVTELPELTALPFVPLADLAFGGWDIVPTGLGARARQPAADDGAVAERRVTALERGFPYVNFTPSVGVAVAALQELGLKHHVPFYGSDGKTGETLVKTVLAPMFRYRNLEVLSWEGFNILGGGDGRVLADPRHKRSKVRSKSGVLASALGYTPHSGVGIEYVPSLGNWKTAWDFVHFRGFLGTKMSVQFLWRGLKAHADRTLEFPLLGEGPQRAQVPGRIRKRFPVCLGPNRKCDFFRISPGEIESALDEGFGRHARLLCSHTTVWRDRRLH